MFGYLSRILWKQCIGLTVNSEMSYSYFIQCEKCQHLHMPWCEASCLLRADIPCCRKDFFCWSGCCWNAQDILNVWYILCTRALGCVFDFDFLRFGLLTLRQLCSPSDSLHGQRNVCFLCFTKLRHLRNTVLVHLARSQRIWLSYAFCRLNLPWRVFARVQHSDVLKLRNLRSVPR